MVHIRSTQNDVQSTKINKDSHTLRKWIPTSNQLVENDPARPSRDKSFLSTGSPFDVFFPFCLGGKSWGEIAFSMIERNQVV